ncbi:MAG: ankyrin repeat domain-containing protein [Bdellovibrionaceae bacterium]|nr:ankyrin repeat domain-containing protein [Pseudobdellovibrionaceae bacterium]NUM58577.1 ankyrin repeat domain-containing protein [Pseudobdellovibrionaceae bacterium]
MKQISLFAFSVILSLLLINSGCQSPNQKNKTEPQLSIQAEYSTAWFQAARTGNVELLKKLHSEQKIPWDFQGHNGITGLMQASRYGQWIVIKLFLDQKVNVNQLDSYKYNAISYALHGPLPKPSKEQISIYLLSQGADPFQEDHLQSRPVFYLIQFGMLSVLDKIPWGEKNDCQAIKKFPDKFSLIDFSKELKQDQVVDFFKGKNCP